MQALYTVFLSLGSTVGGVAGGYIVDSMGLAWLHWMNVLLSAITFALCLVFQAETLYDRPQATISMSEDGEKSGFHNKEAAVVVANSAPASYPAYSYMRSLKLISYRPGIAKKFAAPYKVMRLPGVWLVSGWYAGLVGLIVTMSTIGPQLVAAPPYLWGKDVGLINIGGIIGAIHVHNRSTHTSSQTLQPNASQQKIFTASQSPNPDSSPLCLPSSLPQRAPLSSALLRRTPLPPAGSACNSVWAWYLLGSCRHPV